LKFTSNTRINYLLIYKLIETMKNLKSFLTYLSIILLSGILMVACKPKTDTAATTETAQVEEAWVSLFDGSSTDGWIGYNKDAFPTQGWVIEDGALKCQGSGQGEAGGSGGDIVYNKPFKDFRLQMEWKISEGGNSGIFYGALINEDPIWKSSTEMQVLDNVKHPDAILGKDGNRKAGSLYDLIPAKPQNAKPVGEWNSVEIMVYQGTVIHKMNGETVLEYHLGTPDWDALIAGSKFAEFPNFGKYREGYIGLQDHGNDVWYRNIRILPL
jgi:hypothetical protein